MVIFGQQVEIYPMSRSGIGAAGSQTAAVLGVEFIYGAVQKTTNEYNGTSCYC